MQFPGPVWKSGSRAAYLFVAEDRLDAVQIQWPAGPVNQRMEYLVHLSARSERQIPAVLHLVDRILVTKGAPLLLFQIQRKAEAGGINPTLAELAQAPCSPLCGQG